MRGSRHTHSHSAAPKTLTIVYLIVTEIAHLVRCFVGAVLKICEFVPSLYSARPSAVCLPN